MCFFDFHNFDFTAPLMDYWGGGIIYSIYEINVGLLEIIYNNPASLHSLAKDGISYPKTFCLRFCGHGFDDVTGMSCK